MQVDVSGRDRFGVEVRVVREDERSRPGSRFLIQVARGNHCGTVRTFDEADNPAAERLARACALRLARSLHCRITAA